MLEVGKKIFILLGELALFVIVPFMAIIIVLFVLFLIHLLIFRLKGHKRKRGKPVDIHKVRPKFLKKVFYLFPKQLAKDFIDKEPNEFNHYGLHMFCGMQGAGKTISVVEYLLYLQELYPDVKVRTNMRYKYQDDQLYHWKQLVKNDNGTKGQIEVLDEVQTWFSSNESKNFPPSMLTEISQQRKQRKMLIGTAQVFSRISKPIREQVSFVYLPTTYLGCLTVVKVAHAHDYDYELNRFKKCIGRYFFIHTDKIRNAFDTYEKIERYKEIGFQDSPLYIDNSSTTVFSEVKSK